MLFLKHERDSTGDLQAYAADPVHRRAVERSLHVAIEACLDIGRRVISQERLPYPADNREVFTVLVVAGIVPRDLLADLHAMAGFRHLLVHDYARMDDSRVFEILHDEPETFDRFARAMGGYLRRQRIGCRRSTALIRSFRCRRTGCCRPVRPRQPRPGGNRAGQQRPHDAQGGERVLAAQLARSGSRPDRPASRDHRGCESTDR